MGGRVWAVLVVAAIAVLTGVLGEAGRAGAQVPAPTATPPLPVPDLGGEWSVTRTWYRRCPACASVVTRTTPWVIAQTGANVSVDRGLKGGLAGAEGGGAYLMLEGLEAGTEGPMRFWYATLLVSADGSWFEGGFAGSERISNPCAPEPALVTCFASAGYLRARRTTAPGTPVLPPAVPTTTLQPPGTAPPSPTPATATPGPATAGPTVTASPTAPSGATATPAESPTAVPTRHPPPRAFLPYCRR